MDSRVHLYFTSDPEELRKAEIVILPGSKNTISDLESMNSNGCRDAVLDCASRGATVFGICGGYQMMGECISDPDGVEGECRSIEGLGLLLRKDCFVGGKEDCAYRLLSPRFGYGQ